MHGHADRYMKEGGLVVITWNSRSCWIILPASPAGITPWWPSMVTCAIEPQRSSLTYSSIRNNWILVRISAWTFVYMQQHLTISWSHVRDSAQFTAASSVSFSNRPPHSFSEVDIERHPIWMRPCWDRIKEGMERGKRYIFDVTALTGCVCSCVTSFWFAKIWGQFPASWKPVYFLNFYFFWEISNS